MELISDNMVGKLFKMRSRVETLKKLAVMTAVSVPVNSVMTDQVIYWACEVIRCVQKKTQIIDEMAQLAEDVEEVGIIDSIPGIGKATALSLVAEFGDIKRFATPQKMNAFSGLDIRFADSGQVKTKGYITKRGNGLLRTILYNTVIRMISTSSKNNNSGNSVVDWYRRRSIYESNGRKKIIVAAMDRILRLIHHLIFNHEYFIAK